MSSDAMASPVSNPDGGDASVNKAYIFPLDTDYLRSRLVALFAQEESFDLELSNGSESVSVHRLVLALFTDHFDPLPRCGREKIVLEGISLAALKSLVRLIYTGSEVLPDEVARSEVESLAERLSMTGLKSSLRPPTGHVKVEVKPLPDVEEDLAVFEELKDNEVSDIWDDAYEESLRMVKTEITDHGDKASEGEVCDVDFESDSLKEDVKDKVEKECVKLAKSPSAFSCDICGKGFDTAKNLKIHEWHHIDGQFKCSECGKGFINESQLTSHKLMHKYGDSTNLSCKECGRVFLNLQRLRTHIVRMHVTEKKEMCTICGKRFKRVEALSIHMRIHTGERPFKCDICGKGFTQRAHKRTHENLHKAEKQFMCPICGTQFSQESNMTTHMKKHTKGTDLPRRNFSVSEIMCHVCDERFPNRLFFKDHMKAAHPEKQPTKGADGGEYKCKFCQKSFKHNHLRMNHERLHHTGERPYSCNICDEKFASSNSRAGHIRYHHKRNKNDKTFKCSLCEKAYVNPCSLKIHMRNHTGERPFKCQVCGKGFTQKSTLDGHEKVHAKEK